MLKHADIFNDMHEKLFGTRPFAEKARPPIGTAMLSVRVTSELKDAYTKNAIDRSDESRKALETHAKLNGWL